MSAEPGAVRLRRTVYAPAARVYRAWLDPDMLRCWLVPDEATLTLAEIDERVGGRYRLVLADIEGEAARLDGELLELRAHEHIVLRWRLTANGLFARDSRLTVSLRRASGEATNVVLTHEGIDGPAREPSSAAGRREAIPRDEMEGAWRRFTARRDRATRERLLLTYAPLVAYVADALGSQGPIDDLIAYGRLGLIGAIERFEPDRRVAFEAYAVPRIRGAIVEELGWPDAAPPTERAAARDAHADIPEPQPPREALAQAIARLPEQERHVMRLRLDEQRSFRAIGETLRLTESQAAERYDAAMQTLGGLAWLTQPARQADLALPGLEEGADRGWLFALDLLAAALAV